MKDQRLLFVKCVREGRENISTACLLHGISRPTGYEILRRFDELGADGLVDRRRTPLGNSRAVPPWIDDAIIAYKRKHPNWGPKKLGVKLAEERPDVDWPSLSTIARILDMVDLVKHTHYRSRPPRIGELTQAFGANDVWSMDFKGQFALGCGQYCHPFTAADNGTRFVLRVRGLPNPGAGGAWAALVGALREYGMPMVLRSDNGTPFAAPTPTGLTQIAVRLLKLGIMPERIDPGSPQQNGRHERMHRTLKEEATQPPAITMRAQQAKFDAWRSEFNQERPHEALGMKTPASVYSPSDRAYPEELPNFEYSEGVHTSKVRPNGSIRMRGKEIFISETVIGDNVGVVPVDDFRVAVYAGAMAVAIVDLATMKLLSGKQAAPYLRRIRSSVDHRPAQTSEADE